MFVPKLRFKEFDGAWSETLFQDLFIFKNGVNASKEQYGSGIKFINVLDIINNPNGITYDSIIGSVNITSKEIDKNLVKYGDVLFQRSSETREEVGQSNVYLGKDPVVFGGFVIRGSAQKEYDPIFMNGLLKTDSLRDQITQLSGGSTRFNIGQDSLNKVSAYLPLKEEQTKIASFLSAVDEKISQLTQKHELLSQYKQGMMQKLFSQQLRFKADDGSEFGEWVESKITDVADYVDYRGKTPKKVEDGILLVTAKNIRFGYIDYSVSQEYICSDDFDEVMRRGRAEIGDVLITTEAPLGNVASVDRENIALAQRVIKYRGKKGILNNEFLKQKFLSEEFQSLISSKATGGTVQGIKGSTLHNLEIHIPEDIEEQTKIANFLSAIDQKIEVVAQQIEQAKTWKKGLLQQMFV